MYQIIHNKMVLRHMNKSKTIIKNLVKKSKYFELIKRILFICGLWQPEAENQKWYSKVLYWYFRLHLLCIFITTGVVLPVTLYTHLNDPMQICQDICLILMELMVLTKTGNLVFNSDNLQQMVKRMEELCDFDHGRPRSLMDQAIRDQVQTVTNTLTLFLTLSVFAILGVNVLLCLRVFYTRSSYIKVWFPYDATATPNFEITLLLMGVFVLIPFPFIYLLEVLQLVLMLHVIAQFKILLINLKDIKILAIKALTARKQILNRQSALEEMASRDKLFKVFGQPIINRWVTASALELPKGRRQESMKTSTESDVASDVNTSEEIPTRRSKEGKRLKAHRHTKEEIDSFVTSEEIPTKQSKKGKRSKTIKHSKEEIDSEMERRMAKCVEHHIMITRFIQEFESTLSSVLVNLVVTYVALSGVAATWLTMITRDELDLKAFLLLLVIISILNEGALSFYLCNQVTLQSEMVRETVYDCDWFEATEGFKRSMRIMMSMANQPIVFKAAGIVPINLETLSELTNMIFTYYKAAAYMVNKGK